MQLIQQMGARVLPNESLVYRDAGLRRATQRIDRLALHQRIHLEDHPCRASRGRMRGLPVEALNHRALQLEGGLQQRRQFRRARETRQLQKDFVHVLTDVGGTGEQPCEKWTNGCIEVSAHEFQQINQSRWPLPR